MNDRTPAAVERDRRVNEQLVLIVSDLREAQAWAGGFVDADMVQRMARQYGLDVSLALVGRRLSKLAGEGRLERRDGGGHWEYRA